MARPVGGGGAVVAAVSGTASFVAIPKSASGFFVTTSAAAFVDVRNNNTADTLTTANAQPIANTTVPYEFKHFRGVDTYVAVAGNGGAATVTITFVV